jgi:hypothetical protein
MRLSLLYASSRWPRWPRRTCSVGWRPPAAGSTDGQPGPSLGGQGREEAQRHTRPGRAGRQQGAAPGDLVRGALRRRHHPVADLVPGGARITTEVVKPPSAAVQEEYVGGSVLPAYQLPAEPAPAGSYHVVHETVRVQGLLTIEGDPVPVHFVREQPHGVHRDRDHPGHHDRGRGRRGLRADRLAHPQVGGEVTALVADLHHRVPRHRLHHRVRRRLSRTHPARRGGVQERRPPSAGWDGCGVRRGGRRLRRERADHAAGRGADRDHQRVHPPGRARTVDRPDREPVASGPR